MGVGVLKCWTGYWIWIAWCAEDFLGSSQACLYSSVLFCTYTVPINIIISSCAPKGVHFYYLPELTSHMWVHLLVIIIIIFISFMVGFSSPSCCDISFSLWIFLFSLSFVAISHRSPNERVLSSLHITHTSKRQACRSTATPSPAWWDCLLWFPHQPAKNWKIYLRLIWKEGCKPFKIRSRRTLNPHPCSHFKRLDPINALSLLLSWTGCGRLTNFTHTSGLPAPLFPLSGGFCRSNNWTLQNHDANPDSRWQLSCLVSWSGKVARKGFLA